MIGPHRAGRTVGATGVPGQPNVFYIGVNDGGVWKTTDYGRTWKPIFDDQPTGSIGTLAVAPSDPNVIYVGSGEGLQRPDLSVGDGIYKSVDGGQTWTHLGLRDGQQIGAILVDPRDPNKVFVAVLGHPYGPNEERGVFRSTDGGKTWAKVLYKDADTGAIALSFDPKDPNTIYADLWAARQGPWENGTWSGSTSGLYRSADGGDTWSRIEGGLPTAKDKLGRIGFAIAPSDPKRIYALADSPTIGGLYRSDDKGVTWRRVNDQRRLWGRGDDFAEVKVDPRNPDVVYVANTASYKSTDGGITFEGWKGAPGGDDYHTIWINPENPSVILMAADQGAVITVNGGESWSSWYNQPTAQFYHVITDNRFPYWVYGGQQESGSAGVSSRGSMGQITYREWHPVAAEEYAYVAPDPLRPGIIFGGKVSRYDESTGQSQDVAPEAVRSGKYRYLRTMPLIFSTVDKRALYLASNVLFKTTNSGSSWQTISPDLSREKAPPPPGSVFTTPARRGVVYAVGPSYQQKDTIWAGTDDGLVWRTTNGGAAWSNITPPALTPWSKIAQIDPGRFDSETAYIAVNRFKLDDLHPHIYRTHDGGKSWKETVRGLPDDPINVVREDPIRKGLLYAGSERAVYVSFNDGDDWSPLRLNMPATSIRDLVVHGDDLVIGTHGRSFWILDDVTPLRQLSSSQTTLYRPQTAMRVRWNTNTDTPLPPDEPAGQNPPDGAILNYYLDRDAAHVRLEILDSRGQVVRAYDSADRLPEIDENSLQIPEYWLRAPQILSAKQGSHRFLWDMHYPGLPGSGPGFTMAAIEHDTPTESLGPWAFPGRYSVRLTVDGVVRTKPFELVMDPRVKTTGAGLARQFAISKGSYDLALKLKSKGGEEANRLIGGLLGLMGLVDDADVAPTITAEKAFADLREKAEKLLSGAGQKVGDK